MKRIIALLTAIMLLVPLFPAMADEATDWELDSYAAEGTLGKYKGAGGNVVVPAEIDGEPVRIIGRNAFNGNTAITSVVLPEGVTVIEGNAFNGCNELQSITLPKSLQVIGAGAFSWNDKLNELTIPAGVGYIGDNALGSSLKRITFEGELPIMAANTFNYFGTAYGQEAISVPSDKLSTYLNYFSDNEIIVGSGKNSTSVSYLASESDFDFDCETGTVTAYNGISSIIEIPTTIDGVQVRAIGESAFERRSDIYAVLLPEGLEKIEKRAFALCGNDIYFSFPETLKTIEKEAFEAVRFMGTPELPSSLEIIGERAFLRMNYSGQDSFVLPEGLIQIGDEAFSEASLKDPVLPSTLKYIGNRAFSDAYFTYMAINSRVMPLMGEEPFYGKPLKNLADIDLPWDTTRVQWEAAKSVFEQMGFENLTVWRNNPASGGHCFNVSFNSEATKGAYDKDGFLSEYTGTEQNLSVYASINWNSGNVPTIGVGEGVFKGSQTIRTFYPHHCDNFTTIRAEAFADSTLEYIEMYDSITTVGARAFANCTGLTEMVLPEKLTELAADAYTGCTGIVKADVQCDGAVVPGGLFDDCTNLSEVSFSKGTVPAEILAGKSNITKVTLSDGVTGIASGAFRDCVGITEIELPETITSIAPDAFAGCTALKKVVVRCDASALSAGMFADCESLAYVSFDKGGIPSGVLENCSALTTLALGDGITSIGARAFANTNLPGFVIPSNIPVDYTAFAGVKNLYMDSDATDEQLAECSAALEYPWYDSIVRAGETSKVVKMPFVPTSAESFEFVPETGTIREYLGDDVDVVIPREINGVTVREIAYGAFDRCYDYTDTEVATDRTEWVRLHSVVLPETIEVVGDGLFSYCQQLETFICYAPLDSASKSMFMCTPSLKNVIFVNGVRQIDNYCFVNSGSLENLWLGDKLERVGIQAFTNTNFTKLVLDAEIIDSGAVTACEELTELHFSSRVREFGDLPAQDCPKLTTVCLEMDNAANIIPSGMMLARLADEVTVRLPANATDNDVRMAEYSALFGTTMNIKVVREDCPTANEESSMPDPFELMNGLAAVAEAIPEIAPVERILPEPKPVPEKAPVFKPIRTVEPAHELVPELINVQGTTSTMNTNGGMLYTVKTNADVRYVAMFDESGAKLTAWDSASYSIVENDGLTWYLPYTIGAEGKFTTYFDVSADDIEYTGEKKKITVTVNAADEEMTGVPAVTMVSTKPTPAFRFANTNISARTDNSAKYLHAFDEEGSLVQTWSADGNTTSRNGNLFWSVFMNFERDGRREIVFKASADGETYGAEKKAYITVRYAPKPTVEEEEPVEIAEPIVEPITEPTVEPTAEPTVEPTVEPTAAPVVIDTTPYIGEWYIISMTMDGETYNIAEMGGEMCVTLNADGTAAVNENGEISEAEWEATENGVDIDGMVGAIGTDGMLRLEAYGTEMLLGREKPVVEGPSEADLIKYADYLGEWLCTEMIEGGESFVPSDYGMSVKLCINEDGSAPMDFFGEIESMLWKGAGDGISIMGQAFTLQSDGRLIGEADGSVMIFARELETPVVVEPTVEPTTEPQNTQFVPAEERMDIRYVCTEAEFEGGIRMAASMLGQEYSLKFSADSTVKFVMAGTDLPGITWTQRTVKTDSGEAEAFVLNYYGMEIIAVFTETGFEMNYMDAMLLFFEPEMQ